MPDLPDVDRTVQRIEELVEAQPGAGELVQSLLELYGEGLSRMVGILREAGAAEVLDRLSEDKLVASLLLLHGLHPVAVEARVERALRRVERRLESHRLVLEGVTEGLARVRVEHNGGGAPPASLAAAIEQAVAEFAPDLERVEIEGVPEPATSLVQIAPVRSA